MKIFEPGLIQPPPKHVLAALSYTPSTRSFQHNQYKLCNSLSASNLISGLVSCANCWAFSKPLYLRMYALQSLCVARYVKILQRFFLTLTRAYRLRSSRMSLTRPSSTKTGHLLSGISNCMAGQMLATSGAWVLLCYILDYVSWSLIPGTIFSI